MIDKYTIISFSNEMLKIGAPPVKGLSKGVKAALGLTAAGGVAAGAIGEQAKDDLVMGRRMRKQQRMP